MAPAVRIQNPLVSVETFSGPTGLYQCSRHADTIEISELLPLPKK
jgi:hypothetical protein